MVDSDTDLKDQSVPTMGNTVRARHGETDLEYVVCDIYKM